MTTDEGWQMVEYGRHYLKAGDNDLQVITNPDREDPDRYLAIVNRRPIGKAKYASEAKRKATNFVMGTTRKPRGESWDWTQARKPEDLEAELKDVAPIEVPGFGPQPDLAGAPQPDLAPDPQPDVQPAPPLTLTDADAILEAHYQEARQVQPDPQPAPVVQPAVPPLGTELEVTIEFKAVFRSSHPEAVVAQVRTYIEMMRDELAGDVDCRVSQPTVVRL